MSRILKLVLDRLGLADFANMQLLVDLSILLSLFLNLLIFAYICGVLRQSIT